MHGAGGAGGGAGGGGYNGKKDPLEVRKICRKSILAHKHQLEQIAKRELIIPFVSTIESMAIQVVEFSNGGYKIRNFGHISLCTVHFLY